MPYAARTDVPIARTSLEISSLLDKHKASSVATFRSAAGASIVFEMNDRRIRFDLPLEISSDKRADQINRSRWRALLLCIKAKLESVESGIETFEESFLAHVVMPDGKSVHEHVGPGIASAYRGEPLRPLLSPPKARSS